MVGNDNILIMMMKWEDVGKAPNPLVMTAKPNHAANEIKKTINVFTFLLISFLPNLPQIYPSSHKQKTPRMWGLM